MTSAKKKGDERENLVGDHLRQQGYDVMISPRTMRKVGKKYYSMRNDYFGLFDVCAKKEGLTRWIQVKSDVSDYYKARKEIGKFTRYCCTHETLEVWVRFKDKKKKRIKWRVYCYEPYLQDWQVMTTLDNNFEKINS